MSNLVIVESPAKAKTIKKYLGSDYEVVASMGHVRDLPKARLSVDIKNSFAPKYDIIKGKEKLVKELKSLAEQSDNIYLATDPDREGEAYKKALNLAEIFCDGTTAVIFFDMSDGKYYASSLKMRATPFVLTRLEGILGKENVVAK